MVVAVIVFAGVGLLWGCGILIGSILGSTLPGTGGEGIAAIVRSFPDVGRAWNPEIPSGPIWAMAGAVAVVFAPLVWKLIQVGHLAAGGARWATRTDLQQAGLLVSDRVPDHAVPEPSQNET